MLLAPVISNAQPSPTLQAKAVPASGPSADSAQTATESGGFAATTTARQGTPAANPETADVDIKTVPAGRKEEVPKFPIVTADDRVTNAITLLNHGEPARAKNELADALVIEPNNRSARKLMQQLNESPEEIFPEDQYFEYELRPNDTLISIAERFLKDPLDFYMLAKLNDIENPSQLIPGNVLKIPGENTSAMVNNVTPSPTGLDAHKLEETPSEPSNKATPPPRYEKSAEEIKFERAQVYFSEKRYKEAIALLRSSAHDQSTTKSADMRELLGSCYLAYANSLVTKGDLLEAQAILESSTEDLPNNKALSTQLQTVKNNREAERLYHLGLLESQAGKQDLALETFSKAVELNPLHVQAKKQITDLRLTVIDEYYKKAMVLYRKQELSAAIEMWDEVLRLDPNHELAKQYRAKALELKRKIEQL